MTAILLIDDDPQLLRLLHRVLLSADAGWEVSPASGGREAVKLATARPYDLVITDILMPEGDGLEAIHLIRRKLPHARIIAMTGGGEHVGIDVLDVARALGAHAVLAKPFLPAQFLAKVHEVLGRTDAAEPGSALPRSPGESTPAAGGSTPVDPAQRA